MTNSFLPLLTGPVPPFQVRFPLSVYTLDIAPSNTSAIYKESLSTVVPTAASDPWTFPRPRKHAPGMFSTLATLGPDFQVHRTYQKSPSTEVDGLFWQGHKDLNPEPTVLETAALPIELYPYILFIKGEGLEILGGPSGT